MTFAKPATPHTPSARHNRPLTGFRPGPKAVGSFVPKLAQKAFEKFGFAAAAVLTDWKSIVGPEIAACTSPERLRWPKIAGGPAEGDGRAPVKGRSAPSPRSGATLMLTVDPSRALDVQYKSAQIVERINAYFGYQAVTDIRLTQAPLAPRAPAKPVPSPRTVLKTSLTRTEATGIEDVDLRQALERLGSAISAAPHRHG
jgi:hypothetical protein